MGALANLIKRVTKRQFQMARTVEEVSEVLDRTVAFATGENPYLSESDVEEIAATIPVVEPVTEVDTASETVPEPETAPDEAQDLSKLTKAELLALCEERGIEADPSMTKAQILEALGA